MRFERGTLALDGDVGEVDGLRDSCGDLLWDPRTGTHRTTAHRLAAVLGACAAHGLVLEHAVGAEWAASPRSADSLELRAYQSEALASWSAFDRRGMVVLPTGAGKTRVAIGAILETGEPAVVLCPTRALATAWVTELERRLGQTIGLVGDGQRRLERVTVMTFESAYRAMDEVGDRFGLLVVDEVHHFGGGIRAEALESCAAAARLGLTATAPARASPAMNRLTDLVGPVVFEMGFADLVGTHLANVTMTRISVRLESDERELHDRWSAPFIAMRRAFFRAYPGADYPSFVRALAASSEGRAALRGHAHAVEVASFPRAKQRLVRELLRSHTEDRTIVFTAYAENAYRVAIDNLVPVIAAETSTRERERVLGAFREGRIRAVASARVLNEGIDVPDARVAIIVAGTHGPREHVQRIGRVLRPAPGKSACVYELVTADTTDEGRARTRGRHAPGAPSRFPARRRTDPPSVAHES